MFVTFQSAVYVPGQDLPHFLVVVPIGLITRVSHIVQVPSSDHDLFDSAANSEASRRRACNIRVLTVFTGHPTIFAISAYDRS